jgi:hypothetical protein
MVDMPPRVWPETVKRWWLVSTLLLLVLLVIATGFVMIAKAIYKDAEQGSFTNLIATDVLLNGVAVVALGALVALAVSFASDVRDRKVAEAQRRLELFLRIRDAHVRAARTRLVLCARQDAKTYQEEMRVLLGVVQDLGEVREEVRVSGKLYDDIDRDWIRRGIAIMIDYLQKGLAEYTAWSTGSAEGRSTRPDGKRSWIGELVADYDGCHPQLEPEDPSWEPRGRTPFRYDDGLEQSKLVMRAYVYGAPAKTRRELREQVEKDIAWRKEAADKCIIGGGRSDDMPGVPQARQS